jgi:hypothetical protein
MSRKLFSIVALSIVATALVATAIGASTGPVGIVSLIEIDPKDKAQNEKNGDGRAPVILATHSFVEITQVERLRAFQACQKAGKTDCNTDKYRHEWSVPFITVENANKLEKALSVAWNRFDARVTWRINTVINNFGVTPVPHRDYTIPTFSFFANCIASIVTGSLVNPDLKLGAWDGIVFPPLTMKRDEFCDGLSLDKAVSLASTHIASPAPCGLGGGTVYWNEVARRYAEAMKQALTKYYPDYWIDVAKAFALYMPQALDWGGFGPTSSLTSGTEGGSLIAPVYASIPNPVQYTNLATKAAALDPLVGYSYIMQKYPYALNPAGTSVLQNKGVLSLANITGETTTGISQIEQLKYNLSTREDIFNRPVQWSLTGAAKPIGSEGVGTLREQEAVGHATFLRVFSKVDVEVSPRPVSLMVSCLQLAILPFEVVYPVPVSPGPLPVTYTVPRVHTQWMSVPEGYEIPKVRGVPSFKSLVGINFSIPSLPTVPKLPTFETPKIPTIKESTQTLTKPVNIPAGYKVPTGTSLVLANGQILKAGDILKQAITLPVGTTMTTDATGKVTTTLPSTTTGTTTPGTGGTTVPGTVTPNTIPTTGNSSNTTKPSTTSTTQTLTKPVNLPAGYTVPPSTTITLPSGQVLKPGDKLAKAYTVPVGAKWTVDPTKTTTPATGTTPGTGKNPPIVPVPTPGGTTAPGTVKPTTPGTGNNNTGTGNNPTTSPGGVNSVEESGGNTTPISTTVPTNPSTPVTTANFPVLSRGDLSHCVQMLNALLYGMKLINAPSNVDDFLSAAGQYGNATEAAIIKYRQQQGITDGDPKSSNATIWIGLFGNTTNKVGKTLAIQIGLLSQGYDVSISGAMDAKTQSALNEFAARHGLSATLNERVLGLLLKPCGPTVVRNGIGFGGTSPQPTPVDPSPSTPEPDDNSESSPTAPPPPAPNEGDVTINASVYYPGCQRWDNSLKVNCNLTIEGAAIDARSSSMPGSSYAIAIPAMNVYSEKKGGCQIPYGAVVQITNPATGQSANAYVRDGGPYVPGRNLDMTEPVSRDIGFGERVGPVQVRLISLPAGAPNRASYCFGNALYNGAVKAFPKNKDTIAPGPTLPNPFYR